MTAVTTMTTNILTILAEISLVFIFFFLINQCFGKLYEQIIKITILPKKQISTATIRRQTRSILFFISLLLSLVIISVNGFLIYQGENVRDFSLKFIRKIPQEFWTALGLEIIKCIIIIILTIISLRLFNLLLNRVSIFIQNFDDISGNDKSIAKFFKAIKIHVINGSWIITTITCTQFLFLPTIISEYLYVLLRIYAIVATGLLILKVVAIAINTLDALSVKYTNPENLLQFYCQLRYLIPFLKHCLEYIIYVVMATLVVQQVKFIAKLADWGPIGIKLIAIFLFSRILISVVYLLVDELLLKSKNRSEAQLQRRQTISPLLKSISKYLVYFGAGISILDTVGIDTTPVFAGAGIIGLAVGLGAQNLINDIVSGFFLLFENYYLVGDYIETDTASGYVEAIELRTTRIRHSNGQVHIVRNGDIKAITNYSKEFVYATVDIGVNYNTDLKRAYKIIETTGRRLQAESDDILEATQVHGLAQLGDVQVSIHTKTKVKPGKHLRVQRTLRELLKQALDLEGINPS